MKRSGFADSPILVALKQTSVGKAVLELCREHRISSVMCHKRRSKYGGKDVSLMTRMKEL